jgi:hypothetical protein
MKHEDVKKDKPMMEKVAKKVVKGHEKRMHGMKAGGVTTMDMKKMGRNVARATNQGMRKSAGRGR